MNVFLDLDGTLIDSRMRLYRLFKDIAPNNNLDFDEYWKLKRQGYSNEKLLAGLGHGSEPELDTFLARWFERIESWEYLKFDEPMIGTADVLYKLNQRRDKAVIVTNRRIRKHLLEQLGQWAWSKLVTQVLVTENLTSKHDLISKEYGTLESTDVLVGDTEDDIRDGKALGIRTIAVQSGFRGLQVLERSQPDFICGSIDDIMALSVFQ